MESEIGGSDHTVARTFGVICGLGLAGLMAKLSLSAMSSSSSGGQGIFLMFAAIGIGGPLAVLTLGITLYLAVKGALGPSLFMVIWLPVAASLAIIPVSEHFSRKERSAYASTHPGVNEIHVNLTGRELRLDPAVGPHAPMLGKDPAIFLSLKREPVDNREDKMTSYRGVLLAPDFKSMPVIYGPPEQGEKVTVPVLVAPPAANWAPFLPELGTSLAEHLVHYYFHYSDRVEVASAIDWNDGITLKNSIAPSTLRIHNLTGETIVRFEVDGETTSFYEGLTTLREEDCRVHAVKAVLGTDPRLKLRWQTAQSAPKWNEATPTLPSFREPMPEGGNADPASLHMFLLVDVSVTVQRAQPYFTPEGMARVLESAALPAFKTAPLCGTAADRYAPRFARTAG